MAEGQRNSKRISKPNLRYSDNDLGDMRDTKRNRKPKAKVGGNTSFELTIPKAGAVKETVKATNDTVLEESTNEVDLEKPSNEAASGNPSNQAASGKVSIEAVPVKSNGDLLNVVVKATDRHAKPPDATVIGIKKGRICNRKDLRPMLIKGTTFLVDCREMAESALEGYNINIADLEMFLHQNIKINKNNKITTEQGDWKLMVTAKIVGKDKKSFNKSYLKLLIKKILWKQMIKDWVYVDARLPTTLSLLYYRTEY